MEQSLTFHENMIGADNGNGKPYLKKWTKVMIAKECGFGEGSASFENVIMAITKTFNLAQQLKEKI